jgi:hypothetical protein
VSRKIWQPRFGQFDISDSLFACEEREIFGKKFPVQSFEKLWPTLGGAVAPSFSCSEKINGKIKKL